MTLTYALSHSGYRIKYRVAWHGGLVSCAAWGRTNIMISCVGVMAYLICCEYPAHPPAYGSSVAKGSADTVLVLTLQLDRCSSCYCPEFVVLLPKHTAVFTELLHTSESNRTCYHITSLQVLSNSHHAQLEAE